MQHPVRGLWGVSGLSVHILLCGETVKSVRAAYAKNELVATQMFLLHPNGTMLRESADNHGGLRACGAVWQAD